MFLQQEIANNLQVTQRNPILHESAKKNLAWEFNVLLSSVPDPAKNLNPDPKDP